MKSGEIAGIGIDIVEYERVAGIRFLERFAEYFLNAREIADLSLSPDPVAFIASRFAAKEAVIKAFPGFLKPHDFEIIKTGAKPHITFVSKKMSARYTAIVSMSHEPHYAAGYAIVGIV